MKPIVFIFLLAIGLVAMLAPVKGEDTKVCQHCCTLQYKCHGCYQDQKDPRDLPVLALYERYQINWNNWKTYIYDFICRCAYAARDNGAKFFGIQFYAECWVSEPGVMWVPPGDKLMDKCINEDYKYCNDDKDKYCVGTTWSNFVYELVDLPCAVNMTYKGCWIDTRTDRGLTTLSITARQSNTDITSMYGRVDWKNYDTWLQQFACECATKAQSLGEKYFGLQFWGECWIGGDDYHKHGEKEGECLDECYQQCDAVNSRACVGGWWANAVYEI